MSEGKGAADKQKRLRVGRLLCAVIEIVFPAMVLAPVFPAACVIQEAGRDGLVFPCMLAGFLILLIPTVLARTASGRVRSLGVFLGVWAAALFGTFLLAGAAGAQLPLHGGPAAAEGEGGSYLNVPSAFRLFTVLEAVPVFLTMCQVRMREHERKEALRTHDLAWQPRSYLLEEPSWFWAGWFAFLYLGGLLFSCPGLANLGTGLFIVYGIMAGWYSYVKRREEYMKQLDYISHMPVKRIRLIGGVLTGCLIAVLAAAAAGGAAGTARFRTYTNLREWETTPNMEADYEDFWDQMHAEAMMQEMQIDLMEEASPPSPALEAVFRVIIVVVFGGFVVGLAVVVTRAVRSAFRQFRDGINENGDVSESLGKDEIEKLKPKRRRRFDNSPRERIRREYRRAIRRAMKRLPDPASTPQEIEKAAGLEGDTDMQALHVRYEEARYQES